MLEKIQGRRIRGRLNEMFGMHHRLDRYDVEQAPKIDGDGNYEIKKCLLLGRKVITNVDSLLKSRDITLPTKVHLVKAMVFPVVIYGCES